MKICSFERTSSCQSEKWSWNPQSEVIFLSWVNFHFSCFQAFLQPSNTTPNTFDVYSERTIFIIFKMILIKSWDYYLTIGYLENHCFGQFLDCHGLQYWVSFFNIPIFHADYIAQVMLQRPGNMTIRGTYNGSVGSNKQKIPIRLHFFVPDKFPFFYVYEPLSNNKWAQIMFTHEDYIYK